MHVFLLGLLMASAPQSSWIEPYGGCYSDFDGFVLAIGADVRLFRNLRQQPELPELTDMSDAAYKMHKKAVVWNGGGWIFQPGGYTDHPDFSFAGWNGSARVPTRASVPGIAWDTSHFTRWALWLTVYEQAENSLARKNFYRDLRRGLAIQLKSKVLVKPDRSFPTYRLTNYMDGRNGYFRWNGDRSNSFGPYQLSGTFALGWWSFLEDKEIDAVYRHVSNAFPLSATERTAYFGSVTRISNEIAKHLTRLAGLEQNGVVGEDDHRIWTEFEARELQKELWVGELAQSSYHDLMVPMHVGFRQNIADWQTAYSQQFAKFRSSDLKKMTLLNEMHYLHFISRFLVLSAESDRYDLIPSHLPPLIEQRILELWRSGKKPISQTGWGEPEFKNFKNYLEWKQGRACPGEKPVLR